MGSSFAAGPGVTHLADETSPRCQRSADNYAQQLARKRNLQLVDVSCGGATTAHVLGPWGALAPQVDALTPDTRLATLTIGGNDLGYLARLFAASCMHPGPGAKPSFCGRMVTHDPQAAAPILRPPSDKAWAEVETALEAIAMQVHRRSPSARLIFVDYVGILPPGKLCALTPLSDAQADIARQTAKRLAQVTASVAARTGAQLVRASALSRGHDACSKAPWVTGFVSPAGEPRFAPYHPNLAAMTAIAQALDRKLAK